ncbi:MAG: hypothetical protein M9894_40105 [Planctomycetes bacterium]|nr:hypothetical protein [Planctomycetota bacterium]
MRRHFLGAAGALGLGLLLAGPAQAQELNLGGSYSITGKDKTGRFRGTATLTQEAGGRVAGDLRLDYLRWSWSSFSYAPSGRRGTARIEAELRGQTLRGRRYTTTGLTNVLTGLDNAESFAITYGVALNDAPSEHGSRVKSVGGRFDDGRGQESLTGHRPSAPTPPPPPPAGNDRIELPARLLAVPGAPEEGRQTFTVRVDGSAASLSVAGPGRLLRNGAAVSGALQLQPGAHTLQVEGTGDGRVTVTLRRGSAEAARATSESAVERLYAILWGYQGTEIDYLEGDVAKTLRNVLPHLPGYALVEDGPSFDQRKIDEGLKDPTNPRRVLNDWCVSRDELFRYLRRGTLRGIAWGSHGFMEPFPGCPDEELDMFESRVWTAPNSGPRTTEKKTFVREWREAMAASVRTHGPLDFALMHSCCTGAIGSYRDEVWNYTDATTKSRARTVLGDPLPRWDRLRYTSFDALQPQVRYLKTYVGPSYYGYGDVNWASIRNSLEPAR